MYDVGVAGEFPVMNFHEHKREAFAVAWSPITKDTFASSSWDGTVKIVRVSIARIYACAWTNPGSPPPPLLPFRSSGPPRARIPSRPCPSAAAPPAPRTARATHPCSPARPRTRTCGSSTCAPRSPPPTTWPSRSPSTCTRRPPRPPRPCPYRRRHLRPRDSRP